MANIDMMSSLQMPSRKKSEEESMEMEGLEEMEMEEDDMEMEESPLSAFSDEELMDEIKARGLI